MALLARYLFDLSHGPTSPVMPRNAFISLSRGVFCAIDFDLYADFEGRHFRNLFLSYFVRSLDLLRHCRPWRSG